MIKPTSLTVCNHYISVIETYYSDMIKPTSLTLCNHYISVIRALPNGFVLLVIRAFPNGWGDIGGDALGEA